MLRLRRAGAARGSPAAKPPSAAKAAPRWARSAPEFATRLGRFTGANIGLGASRVYKHIFNLAVLEEQGEANATEIKARGIQCCAATEGCWLGVNSKLGELRENPLVLNFTWQEPPRSYFPANPEELHRPRLGRFMFMRVLSLRTIPGRFSS